jgi:hypothetical protein
MLSNSHTIVWAVNQFLNQFGHFLTCLSSVQHKDLHNMPHSYYEFRESNHPEELILLRGEQVICQHILNFSCELDEIWHARYR